jgi:hypothetical protein
VIAGVSIILSLWYCRDELVEGLIDIDAQFVWHGYN